MEQLITFIGRFHPLLVHLPIGAIIVAFLFDVMSLSRSYRRLSVAVQPALVFGAFAALFSLITGFCLAEEGGYNDDALSYHQYAGIITSVFAFALVILRKRTFILNYERRSRKPIRFFMFIPLMIALVIAGHFGGSLTHGEEFITEFSFADTEIKVDPIAKMQFITQPDEAVLYEDVIQPILESKCYSCHSASKQKGDLRLDIPELMLKGGQEGKVIEAGAADSSSLFARMMLPLEHDDHMPPNEKPQPSSVELDLIRLWINEGADFDAKVKSLHERARAVEFVNLLTQVVRKESWLPQDEVSPADENALKKLKDAGALVLPIAANSNYLQVSFSNARSISKESIGLLKPVRDQIVSLRLSYCSLQTNDLKFVEDLDNLTWLYLDHSNVNDSSFHSLTTAPDLKFLNLVFTSVTEQAINRDKFPKLEQLFTFQTNIHSSGARVIQDKMPGLKIDTGGVALPRIASDTIIYRKKS